MAVDLLERACDVSGRALSRDPLELAPEASDPDLARCGAWPSPASSQREVFRRGERPEDAKGEEAPGSETRLLRFNLARGFGSAGGQGSRVGHDFHLLDQRKAVEVLLLNFALDSALWA